MDGIQKGNTHRDDSLIVTDGARSERDVSRPVEAAADVDAAALCAIRFTVNFSGAMDNRQRRFKRHKRLTPCAHTRVEQEMSEKVHPSGR